MLAVTNLKKVIKDQRGFSLIELLVVVLIIGILVSIAVLSSTFARGTAQRATCRSNLRILDGAANTYRLNNSEGNWPSSIDDLLGDPKYIKREPFCPTAQNDEKISNKRYRYDDVNHTFTCPGVAEGYSDPGEPYEGHTYP